jgi:hypothetical protein
MVSLLVGKWHDGFRRKAGSHEAPNSLRRYPDGVRDLAPSASAPNDRPRLSINLTLVHLVSRISGQLKP